MNHLLIPLLALLFFLPRLNAQNDCIPPGIDGIYFEKRITISLDELAREVMSKVCPVTGRNPQSRIEKCYREPSCTTTDGKQVSDCVYMEVSLSFDGWTCIGESTRAYYVMNAIIGFSNYEIVDMPQQYITFNDAFRQAEICNTVIDGGLKNGLEGAFRAYFEANGIKN